MSKMYGKRRVVLSSKPNRWGRYLVSVSGEKSNFPLGFWYQRGSLFYADLKSNEQLYQPVNSRDLVNKGLGGCENKQALREFVLGYFNDMRAA